MLLFAMFLGAAAITPPVSERDGNIYCGAAQVTANGVDSQPALSPDGHTIVFVRTVGAPENDFEAAPSELWLADCDGGPARRLLAARPDDDVKRNLASVNNPVFSLDGGFVYVMAQAWATSDAIHQVRVSDGREKFVTDGNNLSVIRTGPYRGDLLVQQHRYHDGEGGAYDPTFVVQPDGKIMMMVPKSDTGPESAVSDWLRLKGWTAW